MKRYIPIIIFFALFIIIILYFLYFFSQNAYKKNYCFNIENVTVCSDYDINTLKKVPLHSNISIKELRERYNYTLLIFSPLFIGNFTKAVLDIKLRIPTIIPVCEFYYSSCKYYLSLSCNKSQICIDDPFTRTRYVANESDVLLVYIKEDNNTGIYVNDSKIYLVGNDTEIGKVAWRFILDWYGIN